MTPVRILPEILSNQIAAGEVVQRPVSVVKELVENSIDAKATSITIEVVRGGKSLIRVSDNGIGLLRDDALLSIERYATSKIFHKEDLFSISTMGFRGEALPSIASVSKFSLVTRTATSDTGTRIDIDGGKLSRVSDTGAPSGTLVEVKNLFFNTPARKKFLKSDTTEMSHISDAVSAMALGHSHIRFRLFANNTLQKNFPESHTLFQRAVNVLGKEVVHNTCDIAYSDDDITVKGICVHPAVTRRSTHKIFLFVNHRLIYDRGLMAAIFKGYKGRIMKGRFPLAAIFIHVGFDQVDVNVHPSKREVKFFRAQQVYQAVALAVEKALAATRSDAVASSRSGSKSAAFVYKESSPFGRADDSRPRVAQSVMDWDVPRKTDTPKRTEVPLTSDLLRLPAGTMTEFSDPLVQIPARPGGPRIIGQVMGTYILAESRGGLILVDQHAAHERIVYESLVQRHCSLGVVSQDLIVPETLELDHRESDILTGFLGDLSALGFCIEPFGGTTFVVKAIPAIIDEKEVRPVILDMIEKALAEKDRFSKDQWLDDCLILMACHTAIRANKPMEIREMERLLTDLEHCHNPQHCPHGRPTTLAFSKEALEKMFKRMV